MKKTVCELFAGVGGFRCGLNNIKTSKDYGKKENGTQSGSVSGNQRRKRRNMHMIVMYIDLEHV